MPGGIFAFGVNIVASTGVTIMKLPPIESHLSKIYRFVESVLTQLDIVFSVEAKLTLRTQLMAHKPAVFELPVKGTASKCQVYVNIETFTHPRKVICNVYHLTYPDLNVFANMSL